MSGDLMRLRAFLMLTAALPLAIGTARLAASEPLMDELAEWAKERVVPGAAFEASRRGSIHLPIRWS
jgi:hypothetical protein